MAKKFMALVSFGIYFLIGMLLLSGLVSAFTKKPFLLVVIRSGSMVPTLQRGDVVLVSPVSRSTKIESGNIIVFHSKSGSLASKGWIMHRIVGRTEKGYITQGDANNETDQVNGGAAPIRKEWVADKAVTIGKSPIRIPFIGYIPLWLEGFQRNRFLLPGIAGVLAVIVAISELTRKKKKKNSFQIDEQLFYFLGGLVLSLTVATATLTNSKHFSLPYEVSPSSKGVVMGSSVGVIKQGEKVMKPLWKISREGPFPIIVTIIGDDPQVTLNERLVVPGPGQDVEINVTVTAKKAGKYIASIWVGMFFPFLPSWIIYYFAEKSYWLALAVTSLVPALPLILYPILNARLRQQIIRGIRRKLRRIDKYRPMFR